MSENATPPSPTEASLQRVLSLISEQFVNAGQMVHVGYIHRLVFYEQSSGRSPQVDAKIEVAASDRMVLEMCEKRVFLAVLGGITCA